MNLISNTWGRENLASGDAIVLTELEHHANIVPWQMLAAERALRSGGSRLTITGTLIYRILISSLTVRNF